MIANKKAHCITKQGPNTVTSQTKGSTVDNESTRTEPPHLTDSCQSHLGWGLNVFEWCQIFDLDSANVKTQKMFSSHEYSMQHWRNLIKLTHYDKTTIMAHDAQIVRAKENLKFSHGGWKLLMNATVKISWEFSIVLYSWKARIFLV